MDVVRRKPSTYEDRAGIMPYALFTALVTLLLFASLAFLRYGTG